MYFMCTLYEGNERSVFENKEKLSTEKLKVPFDQWVYNIHE